MKKSLFSLLAAIVSLNAYAQISFEKGYFIDNTGQKTDCLIKNVDWNNNPSEFQYQISENTEKKIATINDVAEFGIHGQSKYKRFRVRIDRSSEEASKLSEVREPLFSEEQLFLKVLVEGKATLYFYEDGNLIRFFYEADGSGPEQLVYKRYLIKTKNYADGNDKIGVNNQYKQQLWSNFKCPNIRMQSIEHMHYRKKDMVDFFVKYNACNDSESASFESKSKRNLFSLTVRPGVNKSSLTLNDGTSNSKLTFDDKINFRFGVEYEFILPYNKNKWAILAEPTYQYYKSERKTSTRTAQADYKSIELPLGIRHYFFLNEKSKVFINALYVVDFSFSSKITFSNNLLDLKIDGKTNPAFGLGYNHNSRYSLELRYGLKREILDEYAYWSSDYKSLSLIVGLTLF